MKIAVFHNVPLGGAKRTVYEQIKYLSFKHELHLYIISGSKEAFFNINKYVASTKVFDFDISSNMPGFLRRLHSDFKNFITLKNIHKQIAKDIDNNNFDAILVHPDRFTQAPYLLKYVKTPSVYFCQELLRIAYEEELALAENVIFIKKFYEKTTRLLRKYVDRTNAQKADKIIVGSRYIQRKVSIIYKRKAIVCPLGVDVNIFKKSNKIKNKNIILFIGAKGFVSGYNFANSWYDSLPDILRSRYIFEAIDFTDNKSHFMSDKQLAAKYNQSFITICASYNEPFGLVPLESMACGTPVLAVSQGGYKETIINGETGYLLPRKINTFTKYFIKLVNNKKFYQDMGQASVIYIKKNWSWRLHGRQLNTLLLNLCKTK
ncbi:MAG: Group 1 glycosyl transferase [Candidatus Woesebacteria bacterium GW2011_GWB1_38_5b]|uniref:Group 1 glycosyl transferase n=1 Tax=Candidatus Woesebacteria bacterium GW2011_GWB1_38_5b TaxID=1618569 RepID=A0A0G0MQK4_9BACT|nr:MAG: Group 1 glycosyl transferase [Candidatus Woesebacteria bacterium GW2011_GWB1_38_5b]